MRNKRAKQQTMHEMPRNEISKQPPEQDDHGRGRERETRAQDPNTRNTQHIPKQNKTKIREREGEGGREK